MSSVKWTEKGVRLESPAFRTLVFKVRVGLGVWGGRGHARWAWTCCCCFLVGVVTGPRRQGPSLCFLFLWCWAFPTKMCLFKNKDFSLCHFNYKLMLSIRVTAFLTTEEKRNLSQLLVLLFHAVMFEKQTINCSWFSLLLCSAWRNVVLTMTLIISLRLMWAGDVALQESVCLT